MVSPFNSPPSPPKYLNISTTKFASGLAWVLIAFPVSFAIIFDNSSIFLSISSAILTKVLPLSLGAILAQLLNALDEDVMALSTSL